MNQYHWFCRLIQQLVCAELMQALKLLLEQKNLSPGRSCVFSLTSNLPFIHPGISHHVVTGAGANHLYFQGCLMILPLLV